MLENLDDWAQLRQHHSSNLVGGRVGSGVIEAHGSLYLEIDLQANRPPELRSSQSRVVPNCPRPRTFPMA